MSAERRGADGSHELRLEGVGLVLGGGFLLAALVGAFLLGRWVEGRSHPAPGIERGEPGPLARVADPLEEVDAGSGLTYFDELRGKEQELEPAREVVGVPPKVRPAVSEATPAAEVRRPSTPAAAGGDYFVQVFAGRDRAAAQAMAERLREKDWPALIVTESDGGRSLFKVRVGGYDSVDLAQEAKLGLQTGGYKGAWVARVD